ncbi:hypothetical protein R1flu_020942 [Riccia fluitans]|uniref:Uncharacterized protein n=1 Tax=Riccia fluitans TaxID=41844 RepID=A0ABD1ZMY8_9MARC
MDRSDQQGDTKPSRDANDGDIADGPKTTISTDNCTIVQTNENCRNRETIEALDSVGENVKQPSTSGEKLCIWIRLKCGTNGHTIPGSDKWETEETIIVRNGAHILFTKQLRLES